MDRGSVSRSRSRGLTEERVAHQSAGVKRRGCCSQGRVREGGEEVMGGSVMKGTRRY